MNLSRRSLQEILARNCAEILRQGIDLLEKTDDAIYAPNETAEFSTGGAIGGHFRHCLEFVECFLRGIETETVDYNRRDRNLHIETDRLYAIAKIEEIVRMLENLPFFESGKPLRVRPEDAGAEDFWCASSVERELEFLNSHTIHHYALIAFKLRAMNFEVPPEFGVAPSTLRFWAQAATKD